MFARIRSRLCSIELALGLVCVTACIDSGDSVPQSPPVSATQAVTSPTRQLAKSAQTYLINYGGWDASGVAIAQAHDLVILDVNPGGGLPALDSSVVSQIQFGGPERVVVLCYVSVGEDLRTAGRSDAELAADFRYVQDRTGPRIDPRGPFADGQPLTGISPLGLPSNGGTNWASWYLDDVSVRNDPNSVGDGIPDRNGVFGGYFVNAGDPAWFTALQNMTVDEPGGVAGLRELLTTTHGRGYGCDGIFMDTFDTAFPNGWTDAASANETKFEWTAPGFTAFIERVRAAYPDAVLLQNRGLFFFNPLNTQYPFNAGDLIDLVMFESFRLNSGEFNNPDPYFYPDNRYNVAPKVMAEANRANGFRVLSLGYAAGPNISPLTLLGQSTVGIDSLLEDIRVAELTGFRHYLTNPSVTLLNTFVADNTSTDDFTPPVWTSTYNDNNPGFPAAPGPPTPRVGIQEVAAGPGSLTVRWDVALDYSRVGYALYYQTTPFDFAADPGLSSATRVVLSGTPPADYRNGVGFGIYANEATVTGLTPGQTYYLLIRAFDRSPAANEEGNQVVLTGVPQGSNTYVGRLFASNGISDLTYGFVFDVPADYVRVYIDRDRLSGTGFGLDGMGADLLIENQSLYQYTGDGSSWSWVPIGDTITLTMTDLGGLTLTEWNLAQADLGTGTRHTRLRFEVQNSLGFVTSPIYEHVYTTSDPASAFHEYYAENDRDRIYYHIAAHAPVTYRHVFIDSDDNPATGYRFGGVGADYLIENGSLYRHVGPGWAWAFQAGANLSVTGDRHDWSILRTDVGASGGSPVHRVVFQGNGNAPSFVAPIYDHRFSP